MGNGKGVALGINELNIAACRAAREVRVLLDANGTTPWVGFTVHIAACKAARLDDLRRKYIFYANHGRKGHTKVMGNRMRTRARARN